MPVERVFADMLAEVMQVERVSVDSNFFDDLGADSMVMARFCARVRKRPDLPAVSIKDIYQHPTIAKPGYGALGRRACCCGVSGSDLGRGAETGGNTAGGGLRGAAVVDLPGIFLSGGVGDRAGL